MSTHQIDCSDAAASKAFGRKLGQQLQGGEVIELVGDVGTGKTTFVRGLARGLGSSDHVSSPTFTLSNMYRGRLELHHLDLYRLREPGLIRHQLSEIVEQSESVIVVEWGGEVSEVLPRRRITIRFKIAEAEARKLELSIPKSLDYISC